MIGVMDYRVLSDEDLAAQLAADSRLSYEDALKGIRSSSPNLGRDWAIYRLESRAEQNQSKERLSRRIQDLTKSLAV
jgi:hypothetical protein